MEDVLFIGPLQVCERCQQVVQELYVGLVTRVCYLCADECDPIIVGV